jgi:apolipoprotein N-acyltransferase
VKGLLVPAGDWRVIAAGAVLLTVAYPPFHLLLPSFVALIPPVLLMLDGARDERPLRRHLAQGFWYGLVSNAIVIHWMIVALWHFTPLSALGYALSVIVLGLYGAALFAVTGWVMRRTGLGMVVVFPILWTAVEWMIGHQGDLRFPWLGLGTSLTGFPTLVQVADLMGARGVTYLLALANTALAMAWVQRAERRRAVVLAGAVVAGTMVALAYGLVRERTLEVRALGTAAVLQPNVGYREKWEPGMQDSVVYGALALAQEAVEQRRPDLVVWPEAAVTGYFFQHPEWDRAIATLSREHGVPQFVGSFDTRRTAGGNWEYFNSAFLFDAQGRHDTSPVYHKRYLVPVVERVPFLNPAWFGNARFFGGQTAGDDGPLYDAGIGRFGGLICYESTFEDLSRRYRRDGADFIVNITNDAWYGQTTAPYQHAAHLVMRAIENRVGIVRAGNTGISEFVDPLGRQQQRTRLEVRTWEVGAVTTADVAPLYTRLGDWVGWASLVGTGLFVAFALRRRG